MSTAEVYVDILFAFNFLVDFSIFSITASIARANCKTARIMAGAAVGAACSCLIFFAPSALTIPLKILSVAASGFAAFGKKSLKEYGKLFALLFTVTFAFGGGVYAVCAVFGIARNTVGYMYIPAWLFAAVFAGLYFPIKLAFRLFNRRFAIKKTVTAYVTLDGATYEVKLLSDTGSTLKEPITKRYVMLVDVPDLVQRIEEQKQNGVVIVPFVSAGNPKGIISGVFADCVVADGKCLAKTVIAPCEYVLSHEGEFNAVISSEAFLSI